MWDLPEITLKELKDMIMAVKGMEGQFSVNISAKDRKGDVRGYTLGIQIMPIYVCRLVAEVLLSRLDLPDPPEDDRVEALVEFFENLEVE